MSWWFAILCCCILSLAWYETAFASDQPRAALRHVFHHQPGPRAVIIALPYLKWQDLRDLEAPHLRQLTETGVIALMPAADGEGKDWTRTWVSLGAGRAATGWPTDNDVPQYQPPSNTLQTNYQSVYEANQRKKTLAVPGSLGEELHERGLTTAVVDLKVWEVAEALGAAIVMDRTGKVDGSFLVRYPVESDPNQPKRKPITWKDAFQQALSQYDVVVLDLCYASRPRETDLSKHTKRVMPLVAADGIVGDVVNMLQLYDALVVVVIPHAFIYENPVVYKSPGALIFYETKHPRRGLLYTHRTRWPGLVTPADFAPALLSWWDASETESEQALYNSLLAIRSGSVKELDRLDQKLSDYFRWGFITVPVHMALGLAMIVFGLIAVTRRRQWFPSLRVPALAVPLVPAGYLLAQFFGMPHWWSFLIFGLGVAYLIAYAASRLFSDTMALAAALLTGAGIIVLDCFTGNQLVRISPFTPPPLIGARYYGLSNQHMGFIVGLTVIGMAAIWERYPWRGEAIGVVGACVALAISMPFWGADWGGGVSAVFTMLCLWILAKPQRWVRILPFAVLALVAAIFLPGVIDMLTAPTPQQRTHIGIATAAFFSGGGGSLAEITSRKMAASIYTTLYTPWTLILAAGAFSLFWILLRPQGPVRTALTGQQTLMAGIYAAVVGGFFASFINDSGVAAGAGFFCSAIAASIFLLARAETPSRPLQPAQEGRE